MNEVICEVLASDVDDTNVGIPLTHFVGNGVEQVGFTKPNATVDEKWIVGATRLCGDGLSCGVGKFVLFTDDKGVKGIVGVDTNAARWYVGGTTLRLGESVIFGNTAEVRVWLLALQN